MERGIDRKGEHEESDLHRPAYSCRDGLVVIKLPIHKLLKLVSRHPRDQLRGNLQDIKNSLLGTGNLQLGEEEKCHAANEDEHNQHERREGNNPIDEVISADCLLCAGSTASYWCYYCTSASYTV